MACHLDITRTGDVDLHLSTALKQFTRLAFEMHAQKGQCPFGVVIQKYAHQLDEVGIFE
jgi:hypothetical protein